MKPTIQIDPQKKLITTHLKEKMSRGEIYEFVDDLHYALLNTETDHEKYTLLSNATDKSFCDLDSARELSDSFRRILEENHVKKFAVYRPQNDYFSENQTVFPDKFKTFKDEKMAREWLIN